MKAPKTLSNSISSDDLQTLSAYLDEQLTETERLRLEARFASDNRLRQELEGLRRTRAILRAVPARKAPHNFILTRAMAQEAKKQKNVLRWFSILRFSSVLAGFAAFLIIFIQLLPGTALSTASGPAQEMKSMNVASARADVSPTRQPPPIIVWQSQAVGKGGGGGYGGGGGPVQNPGPTDQNMQAQLAAPLHGNTPESGAGVTPQENLSATEAPAPQGTSAPPRNIKSPPQASATLPPTENATLAEGSTKGIILGLPSTEEAGQITKPMQEEQPEPAAAAVPPPEVNNGLTTYPAVALLLISLVAGLAAWFLHRRLQM